ncbi:MULTISPECIES: hypothetical protein [unclassified Brevundimonas]|uniref:hypothetical protein n=1 Tax=unclassified Brevundimonas TaxID=2622653 RepID=UPI0025BBF9E4|nr:MULTISPECIES: hypothetical protein [unclassified Brevundimonas]
MNGHAKAPWHLWAVGAATLLWNGFGAFQWYRQVTRSDSYWGNLTMEQVQFIIAQPMWVEVAFGVGVWTGVLGALMLLLRRRLALNAFVASLIAILVNILFMQVLSNARAVFGNGTLIAAIAVIAVAAASIVYAHFARKRGIIR